MLLLVFLPLLHGVWRRAVVASCLFMVLAIGFSRIALGVHYLSDVVGDFMLGAAWVAAMAAAFNALRVDPGRHPVENPIDLDELDLMAIDPLPSWVWYADMADFEEGVSDDAAGQRLERAIRGRGAFRRFKDELFEEHPDLVSAWHAFQNARANRRAVEWLLDQGLIRDDAARKFLVDHPDPDLP